MRKRWKRSFVTALSVALAVGNCVPAMAAPTGWQKNAAGWQWVNADGSFQKGWFQDAKGDWYFLDYNTGVMKTGWVKPADGNWYFMDYHTGAMKTGWIKPMDGNWYYLNPVSNGTKGAMKTGWVQTPDSKWYYLNASGAMQTGTITVGDKVWTLDASGAWNGKDATGVTSVSSGKGSSHTSSNKVQPIVKDSEGNVTINSGNFVASQLGSEIAGDLTIKASNGVTLKDITVNGNLIIDEAVGEGDVTLDNVTVGEETIVEGGGSSTVVFNRCKLNTVKARKSISNLTIKPLHIKFGAGTTVAQVEASAGNLHLETDVKIETIITNVAILLTGNGSVSTFQINAPVVVKIQVNVTKLEVTEEAVKENTAPEITVESGNTVGSVEGNGADSAVIAGAGDVKGYYEITLNPNGGYWVVEDVAANTTSNIDGNKTVKVKDGESIGTVLSAEGFKNPENGDKVFSGWYTSTTAEEKVDMAAVGAGTFFANWVDNKVSVTSATITGATEGVAKVGDTLTAEANADATGLSYQWAVSTDGTNYTDISGATKSVYTVQESDAGNYIRVTISGDNNSSVTSEAVQVEKASETQKTDIVVTKVTATVTASGSAINPESVAVKDNKATVTVAASGSSITVTGISVETQDDVKVNTVLDQENVTVASGEEKTIKVTCEPVEADKYNAVVVEVVIVNRTEN